MSLSLISVPFLLATTGLLTLVNPAALRKLWQSGHLLTIHCHAFVSRSSIVLPSSAAVCCASSHILLCFLHIIFCPFLGVLSNGATVFISPLFRCYRRRSCVLPWLCPMTCRLTAWGLYKGRHGLHRLVGSCFRGLIVRRNALSGFGVAGYNGPAPCGLPLRLCPPPSK